MNASVIEKKSFKMHPKLLLDVIKKQAGTLSKAILEGTMNGIEAGATKVEITFIEDDEHPLLSLCDDGHGISSESDIENHFNTFGTPHEETENKTWAQFRMGRGQLFSFGINKWRTSTFRMEVDIAKNGLDDWIFEKNLEDFKGCNIEIELYDNPIGGWTCPSIDSLKDAIQKQIEYVKVPVFFNGEQLNFNPQECTWDIEDENAYYSFGIGEGLKIYNLGAFVKSVPSYIAGNSGVVVSKKRLDVNFARNDIDSKCPIFKGIQEVIKDNRIKKIKKTYKSMQRYERQALLKDVRDGSDSYSVLRKARVFETCQGKWMSLNMILNNSQKWTFAPKGSRIADMMMEQSKALCFAVDNLDLLNYSGKRALFLEWIMKNLLRNMSKWQRDEINLNLLLKFKSYVAFDKSELTEEDGSTITLSDNFNSLYIIYPNDKLTKVEKRILSVLKYYNCWNGRDLAIGSSDEASAWTDGATQIIMDRQWLRDLNLSGQQSIIHLFHVLIHELAHDVCSEGTHIHGGEFYESYYRIMNRKWNPMVQSLQFSKSMYSLKIEEKKLATQKKQQKEEDKIKSKLGIAS